MKFTPSQQRAIAHAEGNLQLIACAGSGKTEVVACRVVELLRPDRLGALLPRNIVAFTFTDKAAAELKDRIVTRVQEQLGGLTGLAEMFVGTIHAFALDLLKTEVPVFLKHDVLDEVQQGLLVDRNSNKSGLTTTCDLEGVPLRRYVDTDRYITALSILREAPYDAEALKGSTILDGLEHYEALLDSKGYLDYSGILKFAEETLRTNAAVRKRFASRIRQVIVDEYQDVNPIQEAIVRHLYELGASICVVGDDDQTIYQWRGSTVQNILTFAERYPNVTTIKLQENFRSSPAIVEVARAFIKQNKERLPKAMEATDVQSYEPGDLVAMGFDTPDAEADHIAGTIANLQGLQFTEDGKARGLTYSDCAILLRSVRANAEPITLALARSNIPFIITGMNNLFQTEEAQAARELFYYLSGKPDSTKSTLEAAWRAVGIEIPASSYQEAIAKATSLRKTIAEDTEKRFWVYSLQRTFLNFLEDLGLREERIVGVGSHFARGEIVFYNLGKFSQLISDFETIHFHSDPARKYEEFARFLQHRAEDEYPEGWQDNQYANPNAVRIMTVHQAKGMQWPVVFIPALLKNRFPAKRMGGRSVWHIVPREAIHDQPRYEGGIEDERRLFYVALTRSQKFVHLTWSPVADNQLFQRPSEFWEDILFSKSVKRRPFDYAARAHAEPRPKAGITNVVFSFSDLKYFFECAYQFKLRILYGFNAPLHEALGFGKSLHDALAEIHKDALEGRIAQPAEVDQLVRTHLRLPYAYPKLKETLEESARKVLVKYLQNNSLSNLEYAEKTVQVSVGSGVTVIGRIDLVRKLDTNEIAIVDFKSSERTQAEETTEAQLHTYALGYLELTGRNADYVEIHELDEGKKKQRSIDQSFLTEVRGNIQEAGEALRRSEFRTSPSRTKCSACDYRRLCSAGIKALASQA